MLAETVPALHDDYDLLLDFAFYVAAAFFAAEYVLRLIAAPEAPGFEHYRPWRARLYWALRCRAYSTWSPLPRG